MAFFKNLTEPISIIFGFFIRFPLSNDNKPKFVLRLWWLILVGKTLLYGFKICKISKFLSLDSVTMPPVTHSNQFLLSFWIYLILDIFLKISDYAWPDPYIFFNRIDNQDKDAQASYFSNSTRLVLINIRCQSFVEFLNTAQYLVIEIHVADSLRRVAMVASLFFNMRQNFKK